MTTSSDAPVCLVTGAGKARVGAAVAREAARRGYNVAIHYNSSRQEALGLVETLRAGGVDADAFQANVGDEPSVKKMVKSVAERFGHIDLVVNCASTWLSRSFVDTSADHLLSEFSTNVLGTFLVSKEAGMIMARQDSGGHIVVIGDWAIERPYREHAAYLVSKGSLPTLTRVLAVELAALNASIRVNCIAPGPVLPPDGASEAEIKDMEDSTLVRRIGGAESIAQAVFALTDNKFVTGVVLPVDGGRTIFARE